MNPVESCPKTEELSALVDGELGAAPRAALEAHAADCPLCAPLLAEFRQMRGAFAALPDIAPPPGLEALIAGRLDTPAAPPRVPRPRRRQWWRMVPAALGAALSLSAGAYLGGTLIAGAPIVSQPAALQMAVFAVTPPGALCPAPQTCNPGGR